MPNTALSKDTIFSTVRISEYIYRNLRNEIVKGQILPLERLVENQVAKENGVSRTPVREALHQLERDGYIESVPRVGYVVRPLNRRELRVLREIRFINESLAVRWAIDHVTPENILAMEKNLEAAEADIKKGRWEDFVEKAADFHGQLVEASGSARLADLCQNLRSHMLRYRLGSLYNPEACRQVNDGHRRLLEFVKQLDAERAVTELANHLKMSESMVLQYAFRTNAGYGNHA